MTDEAVTEDTAAEATAADEAEGEADDTAEATRARPATTQSDKGKDE